MKKQITITIDADIVEHVRRESKARGRSFSNMINYLLREILKKIREV